MKRLLMLLLVAWIFFGRMTLKEWEGIKNQDIFLQEVASIFAEQRKCDGVIAAFTNGEDVVIVGRCLDKGEVVL